MKPRALDLFCGAGGMTRGLQLAGWHVTGVDLASQPNYVGDVFHQADALTFPLDGFDAVFASPPCQAYTSLRILGKTAGDGALDLLGPVRNRLRASGLPYVIENVEGARSQMCHPVRYCGSSFGLEVRRHRLFESNVPLVPPACRHHTQARAVAVYGDHPQQTDRSPWRAETLHHGQIAMGIDWMTWRELTQAIPPAYAEHIGRQMLAALVVA